jgi:DNA polymerase (family 10)
MDMSAIVDAAVERGVAMEINCQPERLDLSDAHARLARERGVSLIISTDAHSVRALDRLQWGVKMARRAWVRPEDVLNTRSLDDFRSRLRRNRRT